MPCRVLLIDDDRIQLDAVSGLLTDHGYEVIAHDDPIKAAAELSEFQVVISDFMMPRMNGVELLGSLKQSRPDAVRLLMTSARDFAVATDAVNRGEIFRLIPKPWQFAELLGAVKQATEHSALIQSNKRLAEELGRKNHQLTAANRALARLLAEMEQKSVGLSERLASLSRLAAGVAHEINNPLSFVMSNHRFVVDALQSPEVDMDELREVLSESTIGLERIRRITADLLALGKPTRTGDCGGCDVGRAVADALTIASVRLSQSIELERRIPGDLQSAQMDQDRLSQVVLNLLSNAADSLNDAPDDVLKKITVSAELRGEQVRIVVEDTGPGIPPENLERLFEPFFTTKRPGKGTGLGLALSREYVKQCGGLLLAENHPEGGARFIIELPTRAATDELGDAESEPAPRAPTPSPGRDGALREQGKPS